MSKSRKIKTSADLLARERELLAMMDGIEHRPRYLKRQLKAVRAKIRRISHEGIGVSI
jgi:hypothetical protein